MKILDCTIRDGGYYTNWDFNADVIDIYLRAFNQLPIEYLEVGYRSKPLPGYLGKFFYCPLPVLEDLKSKSNKKLAIILNEKDVQSEDAEELLKPITGLVTLVRIAIDPKNFERALDLAKKVKSLGFEVAFNVMYMSTWKEEKEFIDLLSEVDDIADYFYMVDSFGGVYPDDVRDTIALVRSKTNVKLGFHGHNNLEMALANTLTAIDQDVDIVDATITGMGRGAGNLKTELLLTALQANGELDFDYNELSKVVDIFSKLQTEYKWGTNLPYMVSGANSLPQKQVMEWVSKRYYSYNSIIRALKNQAANVSDNLELQQYLVKNQYDEILIVGGGPSVELHIEGLKQFMLEKSNVLVVHSSSRNVRFFEEFDNLQIHCLSGNEGLRLEQTFKGLNNHNRIAVLPPFPRTMGTYVPEILVNVAYQLNEVEFTNQFRDSITSMVLEIVKTHLPKKVYSVGYDGYDENVTKQQIELFLENEYLFNRFIKQTQISIVAILPTSYENLSQSSLYQYI